MPDFEQRLTSVMVNKYSPTAIYVSGSRARGKERPDSDWDLHLIVPDNIHPLSEKVEGVSIDIKYISQSKITESTIDTPYSPAVPFKTIYRNEKYKAILDDLEFRTKAKFDEGPGKWDTFLYSENKNRMLRFLEAINGTKNNPIICTRHMCKFIDLVLLYWFGLKGRWPVPIYDAVESYFQEDKIFYSQLERFSNAASLSERVLLVNEMYEHLFN